MGPVVPSAGVPVRFRSRRRMALNGAAVWLVSLVGLRAVVVQPESCGDASLDHRRAAAQRAVDWLVVNQRPDGTWLYRYDRDTGTDLGGYNVVRHAGVTMSLEQAAAAGLDGAAIAAERGLAWVDHNLYDGPGFRALAQDGSAIRVGATGLLIAALVERRDRTGSTDRDELLHDLGAFLETVVNERGQVLGEWDPVTGEPVPESWNQFFTGEVMWALALLHREFPDAGYDATVLRIADYLTTERDDVEGWWPDVPDHWAAYGFAAMTEWPGGAPLTAEHLAFIRKQMGFQSMQIRWESQRTGGWWSHHTRGRHALGAGVGTVGEALDHWLIVAARVPALNRHVDALHERAACTAGVLINRQAISDAAEEHGAWFQFGVTQMDDQQHALSALLYAGPTLGDAAAAERSDPATPAGGFGTAAATQGDETDETDETAEAGEERP